MRRILTGKTSWPLFGVLVAVLLLVLFSTGRRDTASRTPGDATAPSAATATSSASGPSSTDNGGLLHGVLGRDEDPASNLPACALESLPIEARFTVALVHSRGPFPHEDDGSTYANREGLLPSKQGGYYRAYTVPGGDGRHLVTGGVPSHNPPEWYYSGDSYGSMCEVTELP